MLFHTASFCVGRSWGNFSFSIRLSHYMKRPHMIFAHADEHLACLHFGAITNTAPMNILFIGLFLGCISRRGTAGSWGICMFRGR